MTDLRRHARIALAATVVVAAAFPAQASAAQRPCLSESGRPVARMSLNVPDGKKVECPRAARRRGRSVKAHLAPRFRRLPLRYDDAEASSRPVARVAI
jgi:hypothetical protein